MTRKTHKREEDLFLYLQHQRLTGKVALRSPACQAHKTYFVMTVATFRLSAFTGFGKCETARLLLWLSSPDGGVAERSNAAVFKTVERANPRSVGLKSHPLRYLASRAGRSPPKTVYRIVEFASKFCCPAPAPAPTPPAASDGRFCDGASQNIRQMPRTSCHNQTGSRRLFT